MDKNLKYASWILIGGLVGFFLLLFYAVSNESIVLVIILGIGGLAFCCYGIYLSVTKKAKDKEEIHALQNQIQNEYRSAIAPFYADMRKNYYNLFNELRKH